MPGMHPGSLVWDLYQDLCEALRKRNVDVTFLTRADAPDQHESPHVVLLRSSRSLRWIGRAAARLFQLRTSYLVPSAVGLARHLRRHGDEVDLLHVENVYPDGAAAVAAAALARWSGPILVKPMGEDVLVVEDSAYGFRRFTVPRMLVAWVLKRAAGVRCTSPLIVQVVKTIGTSAPVTLIAVHTSVQTADLAAASAETMADFRRRARGQLETRIAIGDGNVILSLGRLHPYKGIDNLVAALNQTSNAILVVAGPSLTVEPWGDYQTHLRHLAEQHGVQSRVHFLGRQTPAEALDLLAAADVVVSQAHS